MEAPQVQVILAKGASEQRGWSSSYKMQSAGAALQDENEPEARACGIWEWQNSWDIGKDEDRWFTPLEEEEERMEEEAAKEQMGLGMTGGG